MRRSSSRWSLSAPVAASVILHVSVVAGLWHGFREEAVPPGHPAAVARMTWSPSTPPPDPAPPEETPAPDVAAEAEPPDPEFEPVDWPVESTDPTPLEEPETLPPTDAAESPPRPFSGLIRGLKPRRETAVARSETQPSRDPEVTPVSVHAPAAVPEKVATPAKLAPPPSASTDRITKQTLAVPVDHEASLARLRRLASRRGWAGRSVKIRVTVSETGRALDARVKISSGRSSLDEAVLKAVRSWSYTPAKRGEERVGCTLDVPFQF